MFLNTVLSLLKQRLPWTMNEPSLHCTFIVSSLQWVLNSLNLIQHRLWVALKSIFMVFRVLRVVKGLTTPICSPALPSPFCFISVRFLWEENVLFFMKNFLFYPLLPLEPNGSFDYLLGCSLILDFRGKLLKSKIVSICLLSLANNFSDFFDRKIL